MQGKGLFKYTLISLSLGIAPIILMFFIYFRNEDSYIISYLFDIANGYQRDFSEQYLTVDRGILFNLCRCGKYVG